MRGVSGAIWNRLGWWALFVGGHAGIESERPFSEQFTSTSKAVGESLSLTYFFAPQPRPNAILGSPTGFFASIVTASIPFIILTSSFTSSSLSPHTSEQNHFPRWKCPLVFWNFYGFPFIFVQPMSLPTSPSSFNWQTTKCSDSCFSRHISLQNLFLDSSQVTASPFG